MMDTNMFHFHFPSDLRSFKDMADGMARGPTSPAGGSHESVGEQCSSHSTVREQDRYLPIANISRIMKRALPTNGKIAKDAKETVQECVSEFISFITSDCDILWKDVVWLMRHALLDRKVGSLCFLIHIFNDIWVGASDKCQKEKRKTINGDDLLWAMATLGFEDYIEPLKIYLARYRELEGDAKGSVRGEVPLKRDAVRVLAVPNQQVKQ
ncbi:nuclear transcription factor Y subunit B-8 [Gossypium australe]|uniref:Nuclear transcription factor Y subunit B-8 n=1 Tax=Gossypium australe TaxID=47621 RepID=A0A5B6WJX2_9ROSI|nr:nuclear transcription factor Y subunit B-8 [Gossypium australe]